MTIPTTKSQLDGLVLILNEIINLNQPAKHDMGAKVVFFHVQTAFNKMRIKSERLASSKAGYSISLTDQEAMCLCLFLQNVHIPAERYHYESIQVQSISDSIHAIHG